MWAFDTKTGNEGKSTLSMVYEDCLRKASALRMSGHSAAVSVAVLCGVIFNVLACSLYITGGRY